MKSSISDYPYIILGLDWANIYLTVDNMEILFSRVNIREVIRIIASQKSIDQEVDSELWDLIENSYILDELAHINFDSIALLLELIKEDYYRYVDHALAGGKEVYIFHSWVDQNTMLLIKENLC